MSKYMMATKAIHLLGDISSNEPDLCVIHSEDSDSYIGNWVTGGGFIDVRFPKTTTRALTPDEIAKYNGRKVGIPGSWDYLLKIEDPQAHKLEVNNVSFEALLLEKRGVPPGAKLIEECYETATEYVVMGEVEADDETHNCDEMGCGSFSHVVARFQKKAKTEVDNGN